MNEQASKAISKAVKKKAVVVILTPDQAGLVKKAKAYHSGVKKAFGDHMGYAFLAGRTLNQLKESLPHGQFMAAREKHFPEISNGSVGNYMRLAEGIIAKFPSVGNLPPGGNAQKLLDLPKKLARKQTEEVLQAVHELADGKTLTEFYRDLGLVRQPEHQKHTPAEITEEDKVKADLEQAETLAQALAEMIYTVCPSGDTRWETVAKLPAAARESLLAAGMWLNETLRDAKKNRKPE